MKITPTPAWRFTTDKFGDIDPLLFTLLNNLQSDARLTEAAARASVSYRHAWNVIKKWNRHFGQPLVIQTKGQGSTLTELGKKLCLAEQLIDAHLTPQIGTVTSMINKELNEVLGKSASMPRLFASHGYAVGLLPELVSKQGVHSLEIKYMGSVAAVKALVNGECELAGFHVCQHPLLKKKVSAAYLPYLDSNDYVVIRMVLRNQGLIVAKHNPKSIYFLSDLIDPTIQFINRQPTAGTRILLDELLALSGLNPKNITGYKDEEFTHTAIAALVASGAADVGFGIEYAARKFSLDFIPIINEQYVLACNKRQLKNESIEHILNVIEHHKFADEVYQLPGYRLDSPGKIISTRKFLRD